MVEMKYFWLRTRVTQMRSTASLAHYEVSIGRKGAYPSGTGGYYIKVSGQNARVNIGSADHSRNLAIEGDIFDSLKSAVQTSISDNAKIAELTAAIEEMKRQKDGSGFAGDYQKFISILADHITVVAPLLPALTTLLGAQ
jgi:RNA 3'-terminal phosphate cyclase